ncbi:hypothetical protein TNCV_2009751 [Trichonephila clavipes]|nr:hypothetical protein TNCV_2009751 [Trichonephila clavipes]
MKAPSSGKGEEACPKKRRSTHVVLIEAPIMTGKDILECVQSLKSIIDTDTDGENASPVLKSSEMRNIMKKV